MKKSPVPAWRFNIVVWTLMCAVSQAYAQNHESESVATQELETIVVQAVAPNKTNLATKTEGETRWYFWYSFTQRWQQVWH